MKTKIALLLQILALTSLTNFAFAQVDVTSITQGVVYLKDIKTSGTDGGTCTSGSWIVRNLNTIEGDNDLVTLNSDQFTLQPGVYAIDAIAPGRGLDAHKVRLYDVTNSSAVIFGTSSTISSGPYVMEGPAFLSGVMTLTSATAYQLEHACGTTKTSNGFGSATNTGSNELYTQIKITRLR